MNEQYFLTISEIQQLKCNLSDTDYVVLKIAEGAASSSDYTDTLALREQWRARINELEKELNQHAESK